MQIRYLVGFQGHYVHIQFVLFVDVCVYLIPVTRAYTVQVSTGVHAHILYNVAKCKVLVILIPAKSSVHLLWHYECNLCINILQTYIVNC